MKRFISLLACSIILGLNLLSISSYAYSPTESSYKQIPSTIFWYSGNDTCHELSMAEFIRNEMPGYLYDIFQQEGVKIYLSSNVNKIDRQYEFGYYDGLTYSASVVYNSANMVVTGKNSEVSIYLYDNASDTSVYMHEFGHALDYLSEYITGTYKGSKPISHSTEWQALYKKYSGVMGMCDSYSSFNVPLGEEEGFAEAFRMYYYQPEYLKEHCPIVYLFVEEQIEKCYLYLKPVTYSKLVAEKTTVSYSDLQSRISISADDTQYQNGTYKNNEVSSLFCLTK